MKIQNILRGVRQADEDFHLIEDGDSLAVAVSGGKDSMLLFLTLSVYQKFKNKNFTLCGIHIDMGFNQPQLELMKQFADEHGLDLHIIPTPIFEILNMEKNMKNGRIQCSLCSNLKKGTLMDVAKELGCNKVVFGHHGDDAMETMLMNMIHGGRIATFRPAQYMSRMDMTLIRPFVYLKEEEIIQACRQNQIPSVKPVCPNDGHSERQNMKEMLAKIYDKYPDGHDNFMLALRDRNGDLLWQKADSSASDSKAASENPSES